MRATPTPRRAHTVELARLFLRLGATAFGGPAAHIAMMEDEVVRRRGWLTREAFLDLLGATNLIPGPNSTEMAIHIGHRRAGWIGLLVAGTCFITPAALITTALAWAYMRYGTVPQVGALLYGVKPVIIAVVVQALVGLGRVAVKSWVVGAIAVVAAALVAMGVNELLVLLGAGAMAMVARRIPRGPTGAGAAVVLVAAGPGTGTALVGGAAAATVAGFSLWALFGTFLKIGSVLFGSGYVLLAFLREDFVRRLGWLSEGQLLDAVAVGQLTPGPVFTTATFIGYLLGGGAGAAVATVGIFLPAFVLVALSGPLVPRLRRSPAAGAFLDGVNAASLALMAVVTAQLGRAAICDPVTAALAAAAGVALLRLRVSSLWLVLAGAVVGLVTKAAG